MAQAAVYSAIRHYLGAIEAAGTDEAKAVMAKVREIPVNDFYAKNGKVREHAAWFTTCISCRSRRGKIDRPLGLLQDPVDHPGRSSFRPLDEGGCPLVKQR